MTGERDWGWDWLGLDWVRGAGGISFSKALVRFYIYSHLLYLLASHYLKAAGKGTGGGHKEAYSYLLYIVVYLGYPIGFFMMRISWAYGTGWSCIKGCKSLAMDRMGWDMT